jgi:hypothetical protein
MTSLGLVAGAQVWLAVGSCLVLWCAIVALSRGALFGPRRIVCWLLGAWLPRVAMLTFWGVAGWHIFCQRP